MQIRDWKPAPVSWDLTGNEKAPYVPNKNYANDLKQGSDQT